MIRNFFQSILLVFFVVAGLEAQDRDALVKSVSVLPGWSAAGPSASFNEANLDQFDSKLASSLRLYGVDGVTEQAWNSPFGSVKATLFQLVHPASAYGFFTIRRKTEATSLPSSTIVADSFQAGNRRYFWQSHYVVRLEGDPRAIDTLEARLSEQIAGSSLRPSVANHLPLSNLVNGSEEYILSASDLPKTEGLDGFDVGFDDSAEVAAADYRINGKTIHLLLVLYPTQQMAKKYSDRLATANSSVAINSQKRIGPLLAIVSGTTDSSIAQKVMDQVHYGSVVTWSEPQPGLGLGPMIITIFTFIGLLLGACLVAGLGLGGFRIWMKKRFPDRVFDRSTDMEIIQLKLDQGLIRKELSE